MASSRIKIIETQSVVREYGFMGTKAVIDHPTLGRMFIADGFGGKGTLHGGLVDWKYGLVAKINPDGTLDELGDDYMTFENVMEWRGSAIVKLATRAGLNQ